MLVFHLTAEDIEQFGSNALLTELVVFEVKLFEQLLGVVVGALHCHHTGGLLGGTVLECDFLHLGEDEHREHLVENLQCGGLEDIKLVLLFLVSLGSLGVEDSAVYWE